MVLQPIGLKTLRHLVLALVALLMAGHAVLQAAEVKMQLHGISLRGNLELAEGRQIRDGVLLMVHGTLGHNRMETIATQQELLKEHGVSTLAITLSLGMDARKGPFDCNQPMRHLHDDAVKEIAAWMKWLKDQGSKAIWLFGHSRGGNQVALYLLRRHDPAVKKAVMLAPMTFDAQQAAQKYEKRFGMKLEVALKAADTLMNAGRGDEMADWAGILYCKKGRATARSFHSYHAPRAELDTPSLLARLPVPVLVLAAEEDRIVPDLAERMKEVADGKKVQFRLIAEANHFFLDFAAEDAADAIASFLKGAQ